MPTIFGHAIVGMTLARFAPSYMRSRKAYALAAGAAMLPDVDLLLHAVGVMPNLINHRGITHTLLFALAAGCVLALFAPGRDWRFAAWWRYALLLTLAVASHPILDAFTKGGSALPLFTPLTWQTYFSPWRPLEVSPFWLGVFSERGLVVARSELLWLALPCAVLWAWRAERDRRRGV